MKNTGIVIWLILITGYLGFQEFNLVAHQKKQNSNLEKRKAIYANIDERFKGIETYINETITPRFENIEKFLDDNWGEK